MCALREENAWAWERVCLNQETFTVIGRDTDDTSRREIARLALTAREAKVAELEHRINTLGAELNTERAIVKHLREAGDDDTL